VLSYRYNDEQVCSGTLYYRLKQVDLDGAFSYSNTVAVKCSEPKNNFTLYPNPVSDKLIILESKLNSSTIISISVYNIMGEKVLDQILSADQQKQSHSLEVDVTSLPPEVYLIEIVTADHISRDRFVKK
jgi:hypothetical protein